MQVSSCKHQPLASPTCLCPSWPIKPALNHVVWSAHLFFISRKNMKENKYMYILSLPKVKKDLIKYVVICHSTGPVSAVSNASADPGVACSIPTRSHTLKIDHEIISTVILLLPLNQEGLLSVTSESMCAKYWLTGPGKSVVRWHDHSCWLRCKEFNQTNNYTVWHTKF